MRFKFGDCALDSDRREVFRSGELIALPPKAFQLLTILIQRRPKAVSKSKIHEALWPETFVSDANLANLVAHLRAALGDDARNPRVIRTVQRFGYAFAAEVDTTPAAGPGESRAGFRLIWRDREIALGEGENIIGREHEAAAWVDVHSVSRRHARIVVSGETATLEDLGSKNGTFIKEEPVVTPRSIVDGDRFRIWTVEMILRRYRGGVSTESVRSR
jgi:DNA-binding winged helix-turn-helix (wHTH) protein